MLGPCHDDSFGTIVIYLSDVEDGGETVFPTAPPLEGPELNDVEAVTMIRQKYNLSSIGIHENTWQERLVAQCKSRLAVKPKKLRAVLFYSQQPNGAVDENSLHGGCPVLDGVKWAANLWIWNGNVHDEADAAESAPTSEDGVMASFTSTVPGYSLYWHTTFFGQLHENVPIRMNTFKGHVFNVYQGDDKERGELVQTWTVGPNTGAEQYFTFTGRRP